MLLLLREHPTCLGPMRPHEACGTSIAALGCVHQGDAREDRGDKTYHWKHGNVRKRPWETSRKAHFNGEVRLRGSSSRNLSQESNVPDSLAAQYRRSETVRHPNLSRKRLFLLIIIFSTKYSCAVSFYY